MSLLCKHTWKVLSEKTYESKLEHMLKSLAAQGQRPSNLKGFDAEEMTERKHVLICACEDCGKLNKTITTI